MAETQQTIDNANAIKAIIDNATDVNGLPPLSSLVNLQDKIALYRNATGQTVKSTIAQLIDGGVGTSTVKHPIVLSFSVDVNTKNNVDNIFGGLRQVVTAQPLSSGVDITGTNGRSKLMIVVNAGSDIGGSLKVTGTKVDRDTGVKTTSFEEIIAIDSLSVNTSGTDSLGQELHNFTNCYMTSAWFDGSFTISTTDLNISSLGVFSVAFNQFNATIPLTIDTIDLTTTITNTAAQFSGHAYAVEVVNGKTSIVSFSDYILTAAESNVGFYRLRDSNIGKVIDTATDGIFIDMNFLPLAQTYFSSIVLNIWAEIEETVNVVVDGSLGLDSIVYGETLQIGNLVYLNADGKYYKASNTAESTSTTELRLIIEAGILDDTKLALSQGQYTGSGFTAGNEYVGTNGTITSSRPLLATEVARIVSTSINATTRYFDPSRTWIAGDASKINGVSIATSPDGFLDGIFRIINSLDQTKKIAFDLDALTSGITRTVSLQDGDGILAYLSDLQTVVDGEVSIHNQGIASTTWDFAHNLDFLNPAIQVWDSTIAGAKVILPEQIIAVDANNAQITFPIAVSGRAIATRGGTNMASLTADINTLAKLNVVVSDATLLDSIDEDTMVSNLATKVPTQQSVKAYVDTNLAFKAPLASPTFTGTVGGITKTMVGLGNVDNTTDLLKPISTATQTALDGKIDDGQVLTNVPLGAVFTDTVYDDTDVLKDADTVSPVTGINKLITQADVTGGGDMSKATYDITNNGIVDNAELVNGLTVQTAVPLGAVFTDTVYNDTAIQAEVDLNTAKISYPDATKVGFISVTQAVDLDTMESDITTNNSKISYTDSAAVILNTAKVTNATHTGEVTGSGALVIASDVVDTDNLAADLKAEVALGAVTDIDWALGITFTKTLAAAWTVTFSNPVVGKTIMIVTTGDFVIAFPTGVDVTEIVNYDGTKRNVMFVTCVSTALPLYSLTDRAYTI